MLAQESTGDRGEGLPYKRLACARIVASKPYS